MTTTKQSWLKRSLAVLLAVMMVMSAGIANVFAAEKTTLEQLQDVYKRQLRRWRRTGIPVRQH